VDKSSISTSPLDNSSGPFCDPLEPPVINLKSIRFSGLSPFGRIGLRLEALPGFLVAFDDVNPIVFGSSPTPE
jgi:hypothetical protein